jgi:hypothetical protein
MIIQVNFIYFLRGNVLKFLFVILFTCASIISWGQYPVVQAKVDKQKITVGDFITYEYRLQYNSDYFAVGISPLDSTFFAPFTIIKKFEADTQSGGSGDVIIKQKVIITHYDSGLYAVPTPKVNILYEGTAERLQPTGADSLYVAVNDVPVDLKGDIKDIKQATFSKSANWKTVFAYFMTLLLAIFIAYMLWKNRSSTKNAKQLSAYKKSMMALEATIAQPQSNDSKTHLSNISSALKSYAQARFKLPVLSATSAAAAGVFNRHPLFTKHVPYIQQLLNDADMAKFALQEFNTDTCVQYAQQAMVIIDEAEGLIREQEKQAAAQAKKVK